MTTYAVVTTFNAKGYEQYAQRFIETFLETWPSEVKLYVYTENCEIIEKSQNLHILDLESASQGLKNFKTRWQHVPKANGDVSQDPIRSKRPDAGKGFKWDAVRFSHKVYSIFHCAQNCVEDILIWMDSDMVCHGKVDLAILDKLIPLSMDICYLGRDGKYSECGLYTLNLRRDSVKMFLTEFQRMYDNAEQGIFQLEEWHDSFVFDNVLEKFPNLKKLSWSANLGDLRPSKKNSKGEGHPLINSEWGAYLDHLKGSRKKTGKSLSTDLVVQRNESYWL